MKLDEVSGRDKSLSASWIPHVSRRGDLALDHGPLFIINTQSGTQSSSSR